MKFVNGTAGGVLLNLDATDCLAVADAIAYANRLDIDYKDFNHLAALGAAFTACAIVAALDTLEDTRVPGEEALADTRRVWGTGRADGAR